MLKCQQCWHFIIFEHDITSFGDLDQKFPLGYFHIYIQILVPAEHEKSFKTSGGGGGGGGGGACSFCITETCPNFA